MYDPRYLATEDGVGNLFGEVLIQIIKRSEPENYEGAPPVPLLTSGGSVGTGAQNAVFGRA